ncbi:hypothetical protein KY290_028522 [Solanum tuberosum]|uniref:Transmembrane 9 superfamily member n=1 Tax=Solanum tuberosum TaxID=4113 RepID=A0ABQ7ULA5_SOLTU|nr:hypothetical protein KY290_028522 [Solanum tuberosum]
MFYFAFQLLTSFIICSCFLAYPILAKYQENDSVTLWVNKAGPYVNPQETYSYYSLPYCRPGDGYHKQGGLGEVLGGNALIDSRIDIKFKRDVEKRSICELKLDSSKITRFKYAIDNSYWFEFFMDDLPIWGFVGEVHRRGVGDNKHVVYTHKMIQIQYNRDQIISVNLSQAIPKPLEEGRTLDMTYSLKWFPTNISYEQRFNVYLNNYFFENQIHWFSVINSIMMVVFLVGLVSMILMRTLRNDYAKYAREIDDMETPERDVIEESGWKLVHGDVFRPPQNLALLSAVVGTGAQLATLVLLVILSAYFGKMYMRRGAIITTFIVCYALTSFISGYVSGGLYSRNAGESWMKSMVLTASLFPFLCFGIGFIINTIAIYYGSIAAIPLGTIIVVFVIWAFISFPLSLLGTVAGRNWSGTPDNPCRVKNIPRPIPEKKWYLRPSVISLVGGLLPFASIFIEMYYIFASFWTYMVHYYVYGFLLLVFIVLIIVTVCVTIVGTYYLLNAENYHWQWTSFFSAASTALYVYLYAIYYYHAKTSMSGLLQTSFYFGYTLMFCLGVGILCDKPNRWNNSISIQSVVSNLAVPMANGVTISDAETPFLSDVVEGSVDYKGRPVTRSKSGGWRSASFIIGVEVAERFAYYGIGSNLISYLTGPLGQSVASAAENVNVWSGTASLLPLLGAFIADSYLGRYRTIIISSVLYILGLGFLTLSTVLPSSHSDCQDTATCSPPKFQIIFFFFSLYLVAIGQGGHKPCVQAFGADQFDAQDPEESKAKSSFFNWWYFGMCGGLLMTLCILNYVQDNLSWGLGFGIPCIVMGLALVVFLLGSFTYRFRQSSDEKSPFIRIGNVFINAARNWQTTTSAISVEQEVQGILPHEGSEQFKFLNKALLAPNGSKENGKICSIDEVEEAKAILRLIPIWTTCLVYAIVFSQSTTLFTKQGATMDRSLGSNFEVPAASLQSFISLSVVIFIPIYDRILVPIARAITGKPSGITMLQRIGTGIFLSILSMVVAAIIEKKRLQTALEHGLVDMPKATVPMSICWLIPQYILFGISDVFTMVGLQEFFYDQVPVELKSIGLSLYLSIFGLGSFLSSFLISVTENITGKDGQTSWFSDNLNRAHLDYFYWVLAVLSTIAFTAILSS